MPGELAGSPLKICLQAGGILRVTLLQVAGKGDCEAREKATVSGPVALRNGNSFGLA